MKALWLKLATRYDALQLRERWLVAGAVLGGIVIIAYALFIEPTLKRAQLAERSVAEQREQLSALQTQMIVLKSSGQDPDTLALSELAKLKQQLAVLSRRLEAMEGSLLPPQHMSALLEDMIGHKTGLRLLSLKTLTVAPLLEKKKVGADDTPKAGEKPLASPDKPSPPAGLFKHGVEIRLEGGYQDLLAYLERLERSNMKLLWSSVSLSAERHPKLVLTLTVYTLSLDRAWLIV